MRLFVAGMWLRGLLAGVMLLGLGAVVNAHPMPQSQVWIDTTAEGLQLTLRLPLAQLEPAFGRPLLDAPTQVLPREREALARYLLAHVGVQSSPARSPAPSASPWRLTLRSLHVQGDNTLAELEAVLEAQAPPGGPPLDSAWLRFDAVNHEVRTHRAEVYLRNDWAGGRVGEPPQRLGDLQHGTEGLVIPLQPPQPGAAWRALWWQGVQHIATGLDHLLFLLMLVIVAPLKAQAGRWTAVRGRRDAVRRLVGVVTAFTLGHSVTLAISTTGLWQPPAQPVEVLVALSIGVAAVHVLWPRWPMGELVLAATFGLVHGLAFAGGLSTAGLTPWQLAQALLAFNLGIETMQLLVLVVTMPGLLWWAHRLPTGYARLRVTLAVLALVAATSWTIDRLGIVDPAAWLRAGPPEKANRALTVRP